MERKRGILILSAAILCTLILGCLPNPKSEKDCLKIEDNFLQANCFHMLAVSTKDVSYCQRMSLDYEQTALTNKIFCFSDVARVTKNPKACDLSPDQVACYSELALNIKDNSVCDNLASAEDKELCLKGTTPSKATKTAPNINPEKESDCDVISDIEYQNSCYWNLAAGQKNASICYKITEPASTAYEQRFYCIVTVAKQKNDSSVCKSSAEYEKKCYIEIVQYIHDFKVCENFDGQDSESVIYMETCINNYLIGQNKLITSYDTINCDLLGNTGSRNSCHYLKAGQSLNVEECIKIEPQEVQETPPSEMDIRAVCFDLLARVKRDPAICLLAGSSSDLCLNSYVTSTRDLNACKLIQNETFREQCSHYFS